LSISKSSIEYDDIIEYLKQKEVFTSERTDVQYISARRKP